MALLIDASTPSLASGTSQAVSTASFSPPAGSLLVAMAARNASTGTIDVTGTVSGAGLTWALAGRLSSAGGTGTQTASPNGGMPGCAEIWWAYSPSALTSVQVADTVTVFPASSNQHALKVVVITGAESSWAGAITGDSSPSGTPSRTITTTQANSWIFEIIEDWTNKGAGTVLAGETMIDEYTGGGITGHFLRQTSVTATAGTVVTMGLSAPTAEEYNGLIIEVRAAAATTPARRRPVSRTAIVRAAHF